MFTVEFSFFIILFSLNCNIFRIRISQEVASCFAYHINPQYVYFKGTLIPPRAILSLRCIREPESIHIKLAFTLVCILIIISEMNCSVCTSFPAGGSSWHSNMSLAFGQSMLKLLICLHFVGNALFLRSKTLLKGRRLIPLTFMCNIRYNCTK